MGATIAVDLETLPGIISKIQAIHDDIATQKGCLSGEYMALLEAITGTAPIVGHFENCVHDASGAFDALDALLEDFIIKLCKVRDDASAAISTL